MNIIDTNIMKDSSEIIPYDKTGIPLYIRTEMLSHYRDKKALCHWHEDIEFIRILKGKMNYHINGRVILLKKNDSIMVNSRQMHYGYSFPNEDCEFSCILFHPVLFTGNQLLYQKYIQPILDHPYPDHLYFDAAKEESTAVADLLDNMVLLKNQGLPAYEIEIVGLIHLLWNRLFRDSQLFPLQNTEPPCPDIAVQKTMVTYIYQHYAEKLTLSDIAASGSVCRSKCCAIFKRYLQQSPIDFLNACRLEISCRLLKNTRTSITQIALACGFNHLSYYSKLFLRNYGCTPSKYRSLHSS